MSLRMLANHSLPNVNLLRIRHPFGIISEQNMYIYIFILQSSPQYIKKIKVLK